MKFYAALIGVVVALVAPNAASGDYAQLSNLTPTEYATDICVPPHEELAAAGGDRDLCWEQQVAEARAYNATTTTTTRPCETDAECEATHPCMEDEPCWDCRTMGNRICGPGATYPIRVVELPRTH